jgi:hypothetical protein
MPPRYEKKAKERIRSCLKSYVDIVARAESEGFNESDTADIVQEILHKGLGVSRQQEPDTQGV